MLWFRVYKILLRGSEDLDMALKYGKAWDLFTHLFIPSFMQQTSGEHQVYARHCMDWWKKRFYKNTKEERILCT